MIVKFFHDQNYNIPDFPNNINLIFLIEKHRDNFDYIGLEWFYSKVIENEFSSPINLILAWGKEAYLSQYTH